jgi:alpha-beta hydrolase superfamily lysophospholipase
VSVTTDVLGEPYVAETIEFPDDDEGPVVATLVSRRAAVPTTKAVLHVHGFADYFFQTGYAEWWNERGYDFYAIDLRKYGRSIRRHQTPNYVSDLREYFPDLDAAWERVAGRDEHDRVVLSAHSTGGLVLSLWANERGDRLEGLSGMVLNSPWLDLQGSAMMRTIGTAVVKRVGRHNPRRRIPRKVDGLYARSLHRDHDGEWEFELSWKPLKSWPVFAGWLAAIRHGHAELQRGLDVRCPVLVLSSDRSTLPLEMGEDVHSHDIVLDVAHIRRWATAIGPHVTYVAVPGARHDVVLSLPGPRAAAYDEIARWHAAYVG